VQELLRVLVKLFGIEVFPFSLKGLENIAGRYWKMFLAWSMGTTLPNSSNLMVYPGLNSHFPS
jgi:hypothetical protein